TRPIAEDHQVLAHDAEAARRVAEVAGEGHRLPEAPEVLATRCPGSHPRQLVVRRGHLARVIRAERHVQEAAPPGHGDPVPPLSPSAASTRSESVTQPKMPPCALIILRPTSWNSGKYEPQQSPGTMQR